MNEATPDLARIDHAFRDYDFSTAHSPAVEPRHYLSIEIEKTGRMVAGGDHAGAAGHVETLCTQLEYMGLRPRIRQPVAYADIRIQVGFFDCLVSLLPGTAAWPQPLAVSTLLGSWTNILPHSRLLLYVSARTALEKGQPAQALQYIQSALNLNNVCIGSQQFLEQLARDHPALFPEGHHLVDAREYLSDKFCTAPFNTLSSGYKGDTFVCGCPAWLPYPVGNLLKADTAETLWNSPEAQAIRASIHDGSFRYCSRTLCPLINGRTLPKKSEVKEPHLQACIRDKSTVLENYPGLVELNHDNSCNLACPSCRSELKMAKAGEFDAYAIATRKSIVPLLKKTRGHVYISGGGEPFASKHYRDILKQMNPGEFPHVRIILMTNGLLIDREMWRQFDHLNPMFSAVCVSIDAADAETYENVRRPGKWSRLLQGMEFLAELRARSAIRALRLNFVVQKANFRQIPDFIRLGESWGADSFWFQKMANYGSFPGSEFENQDISNPSHPDYAEFVRILRDPLLQSAKVDAHMFNGMLADVDFPRRPKHIKTK